MLMWHILLLVSFMYEDNLGRYGYIRPNHVSENPLYWLVLYVVVVIILLFVFFQYNWWKKGFSYYLNNLNIICICLATQKFGRIRSGSQMFEKLFINLLIHLTQTLPSLLLSIILRGWHMGQIRPYPFFVQAQKVNMAMFFKVFFFFGEEEQFIEALCGPQSIKYLLSGSL